MSRIILAVIVIIGVPAATVAYVWAVEWMMVRLPQKWQARLRPWFWVAPALILLTFYLVYPVISTFILSFFNANSTKFVGLHNYIFSFTSSEMLLALRNNLLWLVFCTSAVVIFGLLIAVLVDRVRYETAAKTAVFLPMAISYVAASVIWKLMYQYQPPGVAQNGTVNAVLVALFPNFQPVSFLFNTTINNFALIVIGVWMWTGFAMVILSAGLKSIPDDIMEAARVDGANEYQIFWKITMPMLSTTLAVVITTMVINILKIFDIVYVMTNGNLGTEVIANRMYKEMFLYQDFGIASAIAVILLLAVIPVMIYNVNRFREQEAIR